ncbi:MAG: hypothetical protein J6X33_08615 [Clostridiales bacterium]|nr:hypothetical protein [Clostridiales bacterium]
MRNTNAVRRPKLAHSSIKTDKHEELSVGDALRKAKKDLFFSRCVIGILIVLLVTSVVVFWYFGYFDRIWDYLTGVMQ